jgi:amino acid transporter
LFALPTYIFIGAILFMIGSGMLQCLGGCPQAAALPLHHVSALTPTLILRAFSGGTTALTGTEAISNGVPAFRYPQSKNAATTLTAMAVTAITMFLGISLLADVTNVHFTHSSSQTVVAQVAVALFGQGFMFYVVQASTALVLVLAANTAFNGLPRLAAVLAKDRFLPRQFLNLGDRLVYSNGVIALACASAVLVWASTPTRAG